MGYDSSHQNNFGLPRVVADSRSRNGRVSNGPPASFSLRDRTVVVQEPHKLFVGGSIPSPATNFGRCPAGRGNCPENSSAARRRRFESSTFRQFHPDSIRLVNAPAARGNSSAGEAGSNPAEGANFKREEHDGNASAFQADDAGSIPASRSNFTVSSTMCGRSFRGRPQGRPQPQMQTSMTRLKLPPQGQPGIAPQYGHKHAPTTITSRTAGEPDCHQRSPDGGRMHTCAQVLTVATGETQRAEKLLDQAPSTNGANSKCSVVPTT